MAYDVVNFDTKARTLADKIDEYKETHQGQIPNKETIRSWGIVGLKSYGEIDQMMQHLRRCNYNPPAVCEHGHIKDECPTKGCKFHSGMWS